MDDQAIISLYWQRSEAAIAKTALKYGGFCQGIAMNILANREDAQECVNDTYLATWNALPPNRPAVFPAFLAKLTRRISIDCWRSRSAYKRGGGQIQLCLDELADCASPAQAVEERAINRQTIDALNRFLGELPELERTIFIRRYFLMDPIGEIGASFGFTESKITSMLHRTRKKLRAKLTKEGYL